MNFEFKLTPWAIASTYAIGNSLIYSWTFWLKFEINILQFASFSDLLPSILYTLTIPIISSLIGFSSGVLWEILIPKIDNFLIKVLPIWFSKHDVLIKLLILLIMLLPVGIFTYYKISTSTNAPSSYQFSVFEISLTCVLLVAGVISAYKAENNSNLLFEYKTLRRILLLTIFTTPVASYSFAIFSANNIINGNNTYLISADSQCSNNPSEQFRYISSISDKAFSMSLNDGSICVFKYNYLKLTPETRRWRNLNVDSYML